MTVYMQSTLELRMVDTTRFEAAMRDLVAIVEAKGWRLVTAIQQISGRLHTAIDIWTLPSFDSFQEGIAALRSDSRFPDIAAALAEAIERETVVFGTEAAWVPKR